MERSIVGPFSAFFTPETEERFRTKFTANGRNDHVTIFTLHFPVAVLSFLAKSSSFAYFHLCTFFSRNRKREVNLDVYRLP